eukprot:scaffold7876_cov69-Alexandrium_tamarense.AAC.1
MPTALWTGTEAASDVRGKSNGVMIVLDRKDLLVEDLDWAQRVFSSVGVLGNADDVDTVLEVRMVGIDDDWNANEGHPNVAMTRINGIGDCIMDW